MQRPILVFVGGDDQQDIECLYLGTDGDKAQAAFEAAGQDGNNSIVRLCPFPEHTQIRTPMRDGVEPKVVKAKVEPAGKKPPGTAQLKPKALTVTDVGADDPNDTGI